MIANTQAQQQSIYPTQHQITSSVSLYFTSLSASLYLATLFLFRSGFPTFPDLFQFPPFPRLLFLSHFLPSSLPCSLLPPFALSYPPSFSPFLSPSFFPSLVLTFSFVSLPSLFFLHPLISCILSSFSSPFLRPIPLASTFPHTLRLPPSIFFLPLYYLSSFPSPCCPHFLSPPFTSFCLLSPSPSPFLPSTTSPSALPLTPFYPLLSFFSLFLTLPPFHLLSARPSSHPVASFSR